MCYNEEENKKKEGESMTYREKIEAIQKKLQEQKISAYVVPTADYHQSEYVGEYFKVREFLSGFTGSAALLLILQDSAYLWTDGRYYVQAERELEGSGIVLMKQGSPGVPNYISFLGEKLSKGSTIALDYRVSLTQNILDLQERFVCLHLPDLVESLWEERPAFPSGKIFIYDEKYHGEASPSKIAKIRENLSKRKLDYQVLSSLDDIAWLYNLRGKDIANNPVFLSYALLSKTEAILYCKEEKLETEVKHYLEEQGILWKEYHEIFTDLSKLQGKVALDFNLTSYALYDAITEKENIINTKPYTVLLKSQKNELELSNTRKIHIQDGVAITKFMYWLKKEFPKGLLTEVSAQEYLQSLRAKHPHYQEDSFHTISAFGANAAMMHYRADEENPVPLREGLFLVDSGGQYLEGTTDITRTFALGEVEEIQKKHFTFVLQGMIELSRAKFLYGCTGTNLDVLARQFVWQAGIDYKCGTGHGIGHFLGVHEGPQGIRMQYNPQVLEKNMIVTNEPGIYIASSHGIRIENELIVKLWKETEHGKFMQFETLTYAPIDRDAILASLLSEEQKTWLNHYHQEVFEKISPFLEQEEKLWLAEYTKAI